MVFFIAPKLVDYYQLLLLPSMKMPSSAVLSLLVVLLTKPQLDLARVTRERPVGTRTGGTPAGGVWLRL